MSDGFDISAFLGHDEGQHFDRKSLFDGPPGHKKPRERRLVRDQIAEYVAAFANSEGGVLVFGIEDDGSLTGHRYPDAAVRMMLDTPHSRLSPPQAPGFVVHHGGVSLLVFDVPSADAPVQVIGDGFPLRIGDKTAQVAESKIRELKLAGLVESWESRPSPLRVEDLDPELLARAKRGAGLSSIEDAEYLIRRKLADHRGRQLVLRRAAELLFARSGPDHPNAGVRIFRVIGTERRVGAEHNVEERPRIEGALPHVLEDAMREISGLLRRPSRLVGSRFRETPEYPEFSWKEALLNAIAHRDYGIEGRTTEVWLFDDRMEVTSPGGLVTSITLEELTSRERRHVSRNPRIVRALVDLGSMRDQGEGIPRMFAEMEALFLPSPEITPTPREFRLTLRNTPVFRAEDKAFIAEIGSEELNEHEFRALFEAHRHGRVDNARLREVVGLDTLGSSRVLGRLRDRGLLELHPAGKQTYYNLPRHLFTGSRDRGGLDADRGGLDADRGGLDATPVERDVSRVDLPEDLQRMLERLGPRPRKDRLRTAIRLLAEHASYRPSDLARLLEVDSKKLVERHLSEMVKTGELERTHPDLPSHPDQRYRARQRGGLDRS